MGRLAGKRVIITGAASGIGARGAAVFAGEDATVVCVDINEPALEKVVREISAAGGTALAVRCDVSSDEDVAAVADLSPSRAGRSRRGVGQRRCPCRRQRW